MTSAQVLKASDVPRFAQRSLPALAWQSVLRAPEKVFLRFLPPGGEPRSITYGEFGRGVRSAAAFLRGVGLSAGDRLLLLGENSPEWQMLGLGAQSLRGEPVGLFANLGATPAQDSALAAPPKAVFVSGPQQWEKIAPRAAELAARGLRCVISAAPLGALPAGLQSASAADVLQTAPIAEADYAQLVAAVRDDDPFLLLFTSGTVRPKGVRVPQRAIVVAVENGAFAAGMRPVDDGLQFLPFGHIAGQCQFAVALAVGHSLVLVAARDDIQRGFGLAPTYTFSVPLIYERIKSGVEGQLAGQPAPLRKLLQAALGAAARVRLDGSTSLVDRALTALADKLVGQKVRARMGGRIERLCAGGAASPVALQRFFEALGIPYLNFYGLSETAGVISYTTLRARSTASAGWLSPDVELRIEGDGEISARGPVIMSGYLDAADQAAAVTSDGFFKTGDIGEARDGQLFVTGRKKHLFVLSTGKKLSPEPVEQAIAAAPPFLGAVLLGDGRSYVTAAVFVAPDELQRRRAAGDAEAALLEVARARLAAFSDYEKPKKLLLVPGGPTDEPSILTPSLKLKREAFEKWKAREIAALYS